MRERYNVQLVAIISLATLLSGCATLPDVPETPTPLVKLDAPTLTFAEPRPNEVVIVINDNAKMVHAGMFAGAKLLDAAGSYLAARSGDPHWQGISLQDYVRFQLDDGPRVKLYRFTLEPEAFREVADRVAAAGLTMPLFCAAKVEHMLSGIGPFRSLPDAWLIWPATLARDLDTIIAASPVRGDCEWPNGAACYPSSHAADADAAHAKRAQPERAKTQAIDAAIGVVQVPARE